MITYRWYQHKYIDNIQLNQSNIIIATMGAGKTLILKGIVDKYFANKRVLIITNRRNLTLQLAKAFDEHTFILAGKSHDESHNIHLATTQTFMRREHDLNDYDMVCVDEIHETYNTKVVKLIRELSCTRIYLTGTPLNSRGTFLGEFDNELEFTNIKQMIDEGYLAPTRFMSRANLLSDESEIGTRNGDYVDADIERIIQKQDLINWIVKDNEQYKWSTEHKCILYANSISTAQKIVDAFADPINVRVIHSKLSKSELTEVADWFESCVNGILVNVRMYTTGTDIPTCDTIINLTATKILSLYLQSIWRASRYLPGKVATVVDYSGNLHKFNPFFNEWHKKKPGCKEQCAKLKNPMERFFCEASCVSEPPMTNCTGSLPYSLIDNPYVSNFTISSGEPCGESVPVFNMQFKSTEPSVGVLRRWTKCKCGCVSYYDVQTLTEPSSMILMYQDEVPSNCVTILFSQEHGKALAILDDLSRPTYSFKMFTSSTELYEHCLKYFNDKQFTLLSNAKSKLPNVTVSTELNYALPLVNWESEQNTGLIKKLIRSKLEHICEHFHMKKGYAYYQIANVNTQNAKATMNLLNSTDLSKPKLLKYFKSIQPKDS